MNVATHAPYYQDAGSRETLLVMWLCLFSVSARLVQWGARRRSTGTQGQRRGRA